MFRLHDSGSRFHMGMPISKRPGIAMFHGMQMGPMQMNGMVSAEKGVSVRRAGPSVLALAGDFM